MDKDHIRQLIYEKLTGIISETDDRELTNILRENPEARELFHQMNVEYIAFDANPTSIQDGENAFIAIQDRVDVISRRRKKIRRIISNSSVAVFFIAIISLIIIYFPHYRNEGFVVSKDTRSGLQLQLANGKVVDLSGKDAQQVSIKDAEIKVDTQSKKISYDYNGEEGGRLNVLTIPPGRDYQLILSDGSKVHLNSVSTLQFPFLFRDSYREVTLIGEGYFEIAPNSKQPFIVNTPGGKITILGTDFNVNTYDSGIVKISLVKGRVACTTNKKTVNLEPGKAATLFNNSDILVGPLNEKDLSWRSNNYSFYNITVRELIPILYRRFGVNVILDNPHKGNTTIAGGIVKGEPIEAFFENLHVTTPLKYYFKDGLWHLY